MRRTIKVVLTLLVLTTVCSIFNLTVIDNLADHIPTVILTVTFLDVSEELYARGKKLFDWLVNKITGSSFSKRWDLEEKINDLQSRYWIPIAITLVVLYFLGRWVIFK